MFGKLIAQAYYPLRPSWGIYKYLQTSQHLSTSELEALQLDKLNKLSNYATGNFPYWRDRFKQAGISQSINALEDLQRLPVLYKRDFDAVWTGSQIDKSKLALWRSGGSTGEPVTIYHTRNSIAWSSASEHRFYSWVGFSIGSRRARLYAAPTRTGIPETTLTNRVKNYFSRMLFLDGLDLTPKKTENIIAALEKYQPELLIGYTSCLAIVAQTLLESNRRLHIPDLKIVNAAEPLDAIRRDRIETAFGASIYDWYASREAGHIAWEPRPRSGLHVNMEFVIVEIVDEQGAWVKENEEGYILITLLENHGMPVIRYMIGDRAVRVSDPSELGLGHQVLPGVIGRDLDVIILPNGNRLTPVGVLHVLKDFPIIEYQVHQSTIDRVDVKMILPPDTTETILSNMQRALNNIMPNIQVNIQRVESIPRTSSGKLRFIISDVAESQLY